LHGGSSVYIGANFWASSPASFRRTGSTRQSYNGAWTAGGTKNAEQD
jgi:hypothetical protein